MQSTQALCWVCLLFIDVSLEILKPWLTLDLTFDLNRLPNQQDQMDDNTKMYKVCDRSSCRLYVGLMFVLTSIRLEQVMWIINRCRLHVGIYSATINSVRRGLKFIGEMRLAYYVLHIHAEYIWIIQYRSFMFVCTPFNLSKYMYVIVSTGLLVSGCMNMLNTVTLQSAFELKSSRIPWVCPNTQNKVINNYKAQMT